MFLTSFASENTFA